MPDVPPPPPEPVFATALLPEPLELPAPPTEEPPAPPDPLCAAPHPPPE